MISDGCPRKLSKSAHRRRSIKLSDLPLRWVRQRPDLLRKPCYTLGHLRSAYLFGDCWHVVDVDGVIPGNECHSKRRL